MYWQGAVAIAFLYGAVSPRASGLPQPKPGSSYSIQTEDELAERYPVLNEARSHRFHTQRPKIPSVFEAQKCAPGFYLDSRYQFPRCVCCSCNGHSEQCEDHTGRCLSCRDNSAGDHCELCKAGFYLNAAQGGCIECPCPPSHPTKGFAVGCSETREGLQCVCKEGHTGKRCERCASGFYGDPLVTGLRCQRCNCPRNLCDIKTGVCRNSLELQNTNPEDQCEECDNCTQVLLMELEKLDVELRRIKDQFKITQPPRSTEELRKIEEAIQDTLNFLDKFSSQVNSQRPKIIQLERKVFILAEEMDKLKEKVQVKSMVAQEALDNAEKSLLRATDLEKETQNLLIKIRELVKQLRDSGGASQSSVDFTKLFKDSYRMLEEMEKINFTAHKEEAEKEQEQARKFLEDVQIFLKRCEENEVASKRAATQLSIHESKLRELVDLLQQAQHVLKKAALQNNVNAEGLKEIQKRVQDLEREGNLVRDQISFADKQLKETKDSLQMFTDSKMEYEELTAQVNDAKTELQKNVQNISRAAAKEKLVSKAEELAESMLTLATELQEALQNVTGVLPPLAEITTYKNITEAIKAAEEAATEAKESAEKALDKVISEDFIDRLKELKNNSHDLLRNTTRAWREVKEASKDFDDQKQRLLDALKRKDGAQGELFDVQDGFKVISRDDTGDVIAAAKNTAAETIQTTSAMMKQLDEIRAEVSRISITPAVSKLDRLLSDVESTVSNVSSAFPSVLERVDELNAEISGSNNISGRINHIKELIEQAREAANRVMVPVRFTGSGHVELRPPKDLDDLRAYTSLTLSLQRPEKPPGRGDDPRAQEEVDNLFVMYIGNKNASGDFIGMTLRNNVLHVIYNLNGQEYDLEMSNITQSSSDLAFFDKIDMYRIYADAGVTHTKLYTSTNPLPADIKGYMGDQIGNLLDLKPDQAIFYVGGFPDSFEPPGSLGDGKYQGCIEFSNFNDKFQSLYNFKKAVNINLETPCRRQIPSSSLDSDYFEGSGYAKVLLERFPSFLQIQQRVKTRARDALLLYLGDEDDDFYYSVSLEGGYIFLRGQEKDVVLKPVRSASTAGFSPEANVRVFIVDKRTFKVIIGNTEVERSDSIPRKFKHYYIGGIPKALRERYNITIPALNGCVKISSAAGVIPDVKEKVSVGRGCSDQLLMVRKAEFSLGSSLEKLREDLSLDGLSLSLGFRSSREDGVLMQSTRHNISLKLSLEKGHVVLDYNGTIWKSNNPYQDGEWHYLTVIKEGQRCTLLVDETDLGRRVTESSPAQFSSSIILGKETFEGCVSSLYLRRPGSLFRAEDLSEFSSSGDLRLSSCSTIR